MIFAIGDIHGCAAELRMLINELPLTPESTVVFVGDYIDRGPDSRGVIDTIIELREFCNVVTLMGNHEQMMIDFLDDPFSRGGGLFIYNGGSSTLQSYSNKRGAYHIPEAHLDFLKDLKMSYETEHDFFVHAGVPDIPLHELDVADHGMHMLWMRKPFLNSKYDWGKMVVHGHTAVHSVDFRKNRVNIDTGVVYQRHLSALALPGHQVIQVPKLREHRSVVLRDKDSRRSAVRFRGRLSVHVNWKGGIRECETVDYSEMGMYMRDSCVSDGVVFDFGAAVTGVIGPGSQGRVGFTGRIVRVKPEDNGVHYGVQLLTTTPGAS